MVHLGAAFQCVPDCGAVYYNEVYMQLVACEYTVQQSMYLVLASIDLSLKDARGDDASASLQYSYIILSDTLISSETFLIVVNFIVTGCYCFHPVLSSLRCYGLS